MSLPPATGDARWMARAIELADHPQARTSPNPTVGCVIVRDGEIVGQGVTQPAGQAHAEVMALADAGEAARGADMYVTLEPCSHTGRTPPCTHSVIAAGVRRVFVGIIDPNPLVHGDGVRAMQAAGIDVQVGLLGDRCARQLAPFSRFIVDRRPWVLIKAAVTLDGRIAAASGDSKWITGEAARTDAHRLRARCDAVLVGTATARLDDPRLTVRHVPGEDPLRIVLDARAELDPKAAVMGIGAVLCHGPDAAPERLAALRETGAETLALTTTADGRIALPALMTALRARGIIRLLVEGGGRLHGALVAERLADEACIYVAPTFVGRGRPVLDLPSADTISAGWRIASPDITPLGTDVRIRGPIGYPSAPVSAPQEPPCSPD